MYPFQMCIFLRATMCTSAELDALMLTKGLREASRNLAYVCTRDKLIRFPGSFSYTMLSLVVPPFPVFMKIVLSFWASK